MSRVVALGEAAPSHFPSVCHALQKLSFIGDGTEEEGEQRTSDTEDEDTSEDEQSQDEEEEVTETAEAAGRGKRSRIIEEIASVGEEAAPETNNIK